MRERLLRTNAYQLLDFGDGRKLESLAGYRIDRPSPAAGTQRCTRPSDWHEVDAIYHEDAKRWEFHRPWPDSLAIDCGAFTMPVRPTPYGHIGLFPEQHQNWRWLGETAPPRDSVKALNLFGYTGASTIALVRAGYHVAHVDAAKPNVQSVRTAVAYNRLVDPPIRYLVDDAAKFAAREVRRDRRYHTIVLDPPAYGHGPTGKAWRLERDLWPLLDDCVALLDPACFRLLITGHSPQVDQSDVTNYLKTTRLWDSDDHGLILRAGRSQLRDVAGRRLDTGFSVQFARSHSTDR